MNSSTRKQRNLSSRHLLFGQPPLKPTSLPTAALEIFKTCCCTQNVSQPQCVFFFNEFPPNPWLSSPRFPSCLVFFHTLSWPTNRQITNLASFPLCRRTTHSLSFSLATHQQTIDLRRRSSSALWQRLQPKLNYNTTKH